MKTTGRCACGGVTFSFEGKPFSQIICHCRSCQRAHAAPLVAAALVPASGFSASGEVVGVTVTGEATATVRMVCTRCGTKVFNQPAPSVRAILPALCDDRDWFEPQMHLYWAHRMVEVHDALPKYRDFPKRFGGSGELM